MGPTDTYHAQHVVVQVSQQLQSPFLGADHGGEVVHEHGSSRFKCRQVHKDSLLQPPQHCVVQLPWGERERTSSSLVLRVRTVSLLRENIIITRVKGENNVTATGENYVIATGENSVTAKRQENIITASAKGENNVTAKGENNVTAKGENSVTAKREHHHH